MISFVALAVLLYVGSCQGRPLHSTSQPSYCLTEPQDPSPSLSYEDVICKGHDIKRAISTYKGRAGLVLDNCDPSGVSRGRLNVTEKQMLSAFGSTILPNLRGVEQLGWTACNQTSEHRSMCETILRKVIDLKGGLTNILQKSKCGCATSDSKQGCLYDSSVANHLTDTSDHLFETFLQKARCLSNDVIRTVESYDFNPNRWTLYCCPA